MNFWVRLAGPEVDSDRTVLAGQPLSVGSTNECSTVEDALHATSLQRRVIHVQQQGQLKSFKTARQGSVSGSKAAGNIEIWNDRIREMLLGCRELCGTFFAANQQKLREHSGRCGNAELAAATFSRACWLTIPVRRLKSMPESISPRIH